MLYAWMIANMVVSAALAGARGGLWWLLVLSWLCYMLCVEVDAHTEQEDGNV